MEPPAPRASVVWAWEVHPPVGPDALGPGPEDGEDLIDPHQGDFLLGVIARS